GRRGRARGGGVPRELRVLPLLRRRGAGQQALRERHVRLDRDPLLPPPQADLPRRRPDAAGAERGPFRASLRMTLQPGCRFAVAPRFHLAGDWPRRLRLGTGVEESGGGFLPCGPWRPPADDELEALLPSPDAAPEELAECVRLFPIPKHL